MTMFANADQAGIADQGGHLDGAPAIRMPAMANRDFRRAKQATVRRHSRFVRRMRVVLPITGGLIALSLFAVALFRAALPGIDIAALTLNSGGLVMTNPRIDGHSENGRAYILEAATATQPLDDPDTVFLQGVKAFTEMADDDEANMSASTGVYRSKQEFLELRDEIVVVTKSGYTIRSAAADLDLEAGTVVSNSEVSIVSEELDLRSDTAEVSENGEVVKFKGNVRILYQRIPAETE
ncbi:MAG: LPS export ABC transporter periplasmic protein LptC [Pseudomonadota bacterium]